MSTFDPTLRERAEVLLSELPKRSLDAAVNRIAKARDDRGKVKAIEKQAAWADRKPLLWAMVRAGHLDANDPPLWSALREHLSTVDGADVARLLEGIAVLPAGEDSSVAGWPASLDTIVCDVYARDPEPIRDAVGRVAEGVARGIATVRLRFGEIDRDALPGTAMDWAEAMAEKHIERYGLGRVVVDASGSHRYVLWPERGGEVEVSRPTDTGPSPLFYEYITLFTPREAWTEASLRRAAARTHGVRLPEAEDAFRVADLHTLAGLLAAMQDPDVRAWHVFEQLRPELEPRELLDLARQLAERREERIEDIAAARAVLLLAEAGEPIPDEAVEHLRFTGYESGYGSGYGRFFEGLDRYREALRALGDERARGLVLAHLKDAGWAAERALPFVADYCDPSVWQAALICVREAAPKRQALSNWMCTAKGLARLGELDGDVGLEHLAAACDDAEADGRVRLLDGLTWAMLELLAARSAPWPEAFDRFLRFDLWQAGQNDYDYVQYAGPTLARALPRLPADRLLAVFERGLDPDRNPSFTRPLLCLGGEHIPDAVIERSLARLTTDGERATHTYLNWVEHLGLDDRLGRRLDPFVVRALASGLPELPASWLQRGMGGDRWQDAQLAAAELAGRAPEAPLTEEPVARLAAVAERARAACPDLPCETIHALRSVGRPPEGVDRVDGLPIGVSRERWPRTAAGELLMHVLTLDLDEVGPDRPGRGAFAGARALALFVENPSSNEAWAPGNEHAAVLALTDDDLAAGVPDVEGWADWEESTDVEPGDPGRTLEVVPIRVPIGGRDRIPEALSTELARLVRSLPGRVGGDPQWIQEECDTAGEFVLQCDERLASINLGDMGRLYVFTDTAFWQCH